VAQVLGIDGFQNVLGSLDLSHQLIEQFRPGFGCGGTFRTEPDGLFQG
jgi:hypothetical protein